VAKSLKNVYVQIIDDENGVTLAAAASNSKNLRETLKSGMSKIEIAGKVGSAIAEEAKAKGIETVMFDRNRFRYHGRVRAVAEAARKGGLKF
jgi:large subunit ribosomal protein L18